MNKPNKNKHREENSGCQRGQGWEAGVTGKGG